MYHVAVVEGQLQKAKASPCFVNSYRVYVLWACFCGMKFVMNARGKSI